MRDREKDDFIQEEHREQSTSRWSHGVFKQLPKAGVAAALCTTVWASRALHHRSNGEESKYRKETEYNREKC